MLCDRAGHLYLNVRYLIFIYSNIYYFDLFQNRSIQQHALKTFPSNVESRTIHSLAFRGVGFQLVKIMYF